MNGFLRALEEQRWDDHRFYHHSRINQSLHLLSAISFLCTYVLLFTRPVAAALLGWLFAMLIRQVGHFFFEPKGYDRANRVTHAYKERVKVGYNLRRKVVLLSLWLLVTLAIVARPAPQDFGEGDGPSVLLRNVSIAWLLLGVGAVLFRTLQLCFIRDVQTGLVWLTKILTDPFHDVMLYHKAPYHVLRGELFDPIVPETGASEARA